MKRTSFAEVELDFLLSGVERSVVPHFCEHEKHKMAHDILELIQSKYIVIESKRPIDKGKLEPFLGEIIWERPEGTHIMRCKGSFTIRGKDGTL